MVNVKSLLPDIVGSIHVQGVSENATLRPLM